MAIDIKVPTVGESISEVTLLKWTKKDGEYVERDEVIAELESEKATFEVNAEKAGVLKTGAREGDTLKIGDLLASIDESAAKPEGKEQPKQTKTEAPKETPRAEEKQSSAPVTSVPNDIKASPVASAMIADKKVDPKQVTPTGFQGKIMKDDVLAALNNPGKKTFNGASLFSRETRTEKMSNLRKTISRRLV
ncbi:MAG: dihydrolipoyllysine-residue succinyltransferase, partial [Chitinophagaceae bacterium]